MAKARKCDRCGKLYESYNTDNKRNTFNALIFINLDDNERYYTRKISDLCPECSEMISEFYSEKDISIEGDNLSKTTNLNIDEVTITKVVGVKENENKNTKEDIND